MHTGIASSSLRELDGIALATNIIVFMEGDTKGGRMAISTRIIKGVAILDLQGEMTFWQGRGELHNKVRELVDTGIRNILLNAQGVGEVDSSGIGEFVGSYTTVSNRGGHLKLLNLTDKLNQVIETTNLNNIFETYDNEQRAISSFL